MDRKKCKELKLKLKKNKEKIERKKIKYENRENERKEKREKRDEMKKKEEHKIWWEERKKKVALKKYRLQLIKERLERKKKQIVVAGLAWSGSKRLVHLIKLLYEVIGESVKINHCHSLKGYMLHNADIILLPTRHIFDTAISGILKCARKIENGEKIKKPITGKHSGMSELTHSRCIKQFETNTNIPIDISEIIYTCNWNISKFNRAKNVSKEKTCYYFFYEKYSFEYIKKLCIFLNIKIDDNMIYEVIKRNSLDKSSIKNTSNGVLYRYKQLLSEKQIDILLEDEKIYNYLKDMDYV